MNHIIKIEREDIVTSRIGNNINVKIDEKLSLVFTPEALDELFADYASIKSEIEEEQTNVINQARTETIITNQLELPFEP